MDAFREPVYYTTSVGWINRAGPTLLSWGGPGRAMDKGLLCRFCNRYRLCSQNAPASPLLLSDYWASRITLDDRITTIYLGDGGLDGGESWANIDQCGLLKGFIGPENDTNIRLTCASRVSFNDVRQQSTYRW